MKTTVTNPQKAFALIALVLAIAAMAIYVADADDAPGAAVVGMLLMVASVVGGLLLIFFPFFFPSQSFPAKPTTESFRGISVIAGSEISSRKTALRDREERRIADYRKSPLSRLLTLND